MNWYILIPIIVGILSAILGYIIGKFLRVNSDSKATYVDKILKLEASLEACKAKKSVSINLENTKNIIEKKEIKVTKEFEFDKSRNLVVNERVITISKEVCNNLIIEKRP